MTVRREDVPGLPTATRGMRFVLEDDGADVGELTLSLVAGEWFGHDGRVRSADVSGWARLLLSARRWLRGNGVKEMLIHFEGDGATRAFWERRGFVPATTIYRGAV